jgi:hypothetical protein
MTFLVVTNNVFNQMQAYKTMDITTSSRQKMKFNFLDKIQEKVDSIRWDRASKITKVLDTIIYFATDRGYSFFGRETLARKCQVSLRTVDKAIKVLKDSEEAVVAYRQNPKGNSCKTPIILLKRHKHFSYWSKLLNLECEVECEEENAETPDETSVGELKKIATSTLPTLKSFNNTSLDELDDSYVPSYINQEFVKAAAPFFHANKIYQLWLKVLIAYRNSNVDAPLDTLMETVIKSFKETIFLHKQGKIKKTFDGYFYRLLEGELSVMKRRENRHRLPNWLDF